MEPKLKELYEARKIVKVDVFDYLGPYMSVTTGRVMFWSFLDLWATYDSLADYCKYPSETVEIRDTLDEAIAYLMSED